MIFPEAKCIK